ncbi:hypothetical protein HPP92_008102 [Vanilla planifolia]|uniref:Secreted protein n=1 Tax=Vanilla planifolia TaxID=51239 RepID=A0A835RBH2_VANPL|nr:hypothetical protein HPP92_008102 [Vanilla planifolia]
MSASLGGIALFLFAFSRAGDRVCSPLRSINLHSVCLIPLAHFAQSVLTMRMGSLANGCSKDEAKVMMKKKEVAQASSIL